MHKISQKLPQKRHFGRILCKMPENIQNLLVKKWVIAFSKYKKLQQKKSNEMLLFLLVLASTFACGIVTVGMRSEVYVVFAHKTVEAVVRVA